MSEWIECTLGDLITLQRGHDLPRSKMSKGNVPVAGSNGVIGYHSEATTKSPGVTIGRSGNIGNAYLYTEDFWAHNTTLYVRDFKGNDSIFVYYFLKNIDFSQFNSGSAVPTLNRNHIHPLPIAIPPSLPEQKAIAAVLSSLDDKIDLLHRQNKTLEAMAQTLFRQWFVEEDVEKTTLGEVIKTTSGGTPSRKKMEYYNSGTIKWVKSKELNGTYITDTEEKITKSGLKKSSAKLLPENAVLIALYGATVGEYGILSSPATCNQAVCAMFPNNDYPYSFLFMLAKTSKNRLINMAVGSAQQNISQALIRQLEIPAPSKKILEYHDRVKGLFERMKANLLQIRTLEQLRDTLLPKLMSGAVRVRV